MTENEQIDRRSISRHMYGLLKVVGGGDVTVGSLRTCRDITAWACAKRGYFVKTGTSDNSRVLLSREGEKVLSAYRHAIMPTREADKDLSDRLTRELRGGPRLVRKVHQGAA